jgi:hypothetical protein
LGKIVESGKIRNQHNGEDVDYTIIHGLNSEYAYNADFEWLQFNLKIIAELRRICKTEEELLEKIREHQFQDKHWSWIRKSAVMCSEDYEWFYFIAEDKVQGACVIYHPKPSRIDSKDIFYVEYIAVASWNRKNVLAPKKFKGVGPFLLRSTLNYSITVLGYRAGFSLHSLPEAVDFYEKCGMINFGPDEEKQNLPYFEMEYENARRFADD